ncbi:MAG TPA: SIMPL domain-containing protein [Acidimicrobiales bacterium]|nr:SIMPL domain-containing protein [Acidimicrobiales bacterium]
MDEFETDAAGGAPGGVQDASAPAIDVMRGARRRTPRRQALVAGGVALVVVGAAVGFALPHGGGALASSTSGLIQSGAQITVTGTATVQGTPDTVNFQIGVSSTARTAIAALNKNNAEVSDLEAALEANGVTLPEMQTSQLDIYANTNNSGAVTGFSVDDDLNVTMSQVSDAGAALDAAADAVGNDVTLNGITFSISNTSSLLATARAEAMENARTDADQLAAGAGVKLGPIMRVTDETDTQVTYNYDEPLAAGAARASVPIESGTQPVSVQVSVVYALQS